ncbi:MAG: methyltransferase [Acidobacteriota bacterium]|nr:methyltransferase [Acidobacteriota bacterium]
MTTFSPASKQRLTDRDLDRFPGETLFDGIARAVCHAGCLPRKELYEAWEVARRARRLFRGGRVVDLGAGHALLGQILLLLDDTSPNVVAVDTHLPSSCAKLHEVLVQSWPRLAGRVAFEMQPLDAIELHQDDLVVSSHACGALTDVVLARAVAARARVAVLPCCHHVVVGGGNPFLSAEARSAKVEGLPDLSGWLDGPLAIDVMRAVRLEREGYRVWTQTIPADVTPKNRLMLASPSTL